MSKRQKLQPIIGMNYSMQPRNAFVFMVLMSPLQVVIDHAGVGRATFYRNFCDRKALISALLERAITQLEQKLLIFNNSKMVYFV